MFVGLKPNFPYDIDEMIKRKTEEPLFCPQCKKELSYAQNKEGVMYFVHKDGSECDNFTRPITPWRKRWTKRFVKNDRNVPVYITINELEYLKAAKKFNFYTGNPEKLDNEIKILSEKKLEELKTLNLAHRADVLFQNYVLEFVDFGLSPEEFNERNWFYTTAKLNVIWIFNVPETLKQDLYCYNRKKEGNKYVCKTEFPIWENWSAKYDYDIFVFLEVKKKQKEDENSDETPAGYLEQIVWQPDSPDAKNKFFVTRNYPRNFRELKEMMTEMHPPFIYPFYKGYNILTPTIVSTLLRKKFDWHEFIWYISQFTEIISYNENSFTIFVSTQKHANFISLKIPKYKRKEWANNFAYAKEDDVWKTCFANVEKNLKILEQLIADKPYSETITNI